MASYAAGSTARFPAVTRRTLGNGGSAWYLSADLEERDLSELLELVLAEAQISPAAEMSRGVEVVRRASGTASYLFLLNHTDEEARATASGVDLLTDNQVSSEIVLAAGGVAVIREE